MRRASAAGRPRAFASRAASKDESVSAPVSRRTAPLFGGLLVLLLPWAAAAIDFPPIEQSPELFRLHRERLLASLPANSVAVFRSAPHRTMSHDTTYLYRQD
jgi:hypothetical protein